MSVVSSMLYFSETGILWAGTGGAGNTLCGLCLFTVNPATGEATFLSGPDSGFGLAGLARNSNGDIYTIPGDVDEINSVDPVTGALTVIGNYGGGSAGNGMTFDLNDTFYVAAGEFVNEVVPATATLVNSVPFNYVGFVTNPSTGPKIASMTTNPVDGTIYGLLRDGGSGTAITFLVTVDPVSGDITHVAELSVHLDGLVLVPTGFIP